MTSVCLVFMDKLRVFSRSPSSTWRQTTIINPIENLWSLLKKQVWKNNDLNVTELKARIIDVWHHALDGSVLKTLALSMKTRLTEVIKVKGGHTKY